MFTVTFGASNSFIIEIHLVLLFTLHNTKNIAYHIMEVLIFYADKLVVMGNSKNLHVFNFAILLKSRKFDPHEICMFYSNCCYLLSLSSSISHTQAFNIHYCFISTSLFHVAAVSGHF